MQPPNERIMPSRPLQRIVLIAVAAGMTAGATNLVAAVAIFGGTMTHGFQMIASGLLGEQAFSGGLKAAILGAVLHFAISIAAAGLYLWAAPPWGSTSGQLFVMVQQPGTGWPVVCCSVLSSI